MRKYEDYTPEIAEMLEKGKSIDEIALHFKKSTRRIEERLREVGYRKPKGKWIKPEKVKEEKEEKEEVAEQWLVALRGIKTDRLVNYYKLDLIKQLN